MQRYGLGQFVPRMSPMQLLGAGQQRASQQTSSTTPLNITEWKNVIEKILEEKTEHTTFSTLLDALNISDIEKANITYQPSARIDIEYAVSDPITIQLTQEDLQLFENKKQELEAQAIDDGTEPASHVDPAAANTMPSVQAPVLVRPATTTTTPTAATRTTPAPASTPTNIQATTPAPASTPTNIQATTPAAQGQQQAPAANTTSHDHHDDTKSDSDADKKHPYGHPPYYNPYDQEKGANVSPMQNFDSQNDNSGKSGRGSRSKNNFDPYSSYGDPYYGMGGGYDAPMSVYTGGGGYYDRPAGYVGRSLPEQVGFSVTKPSTTQPQYSPYADLKKLSSQGKTITKSTVSSSDIEFTPTGYRRTVEFEPEPLYHNRVTESNKRLRIAPVSDDPIVSTEEQNNGTPAIIEKKAVPFLESLWNTITEPIKTAIHWFTSLFYRK